jgi:hypothetical protein
LYLAHDTLAHLEAEEYRRGGRQGPIMTRHICTRCIEDQFLAAIVQGDGEHALCDVCEKRRTRTVTIERLGELLALVILEYYEQGDDLPRFYDDDDRPTYEQAGEDLNSIAQEILEQELDFQDEVVQAVIDSDGYDPRDEFLRSSA